MRELLRIYLLWSEIPLSFQASAHFGVGSTISRSLLSCTVIYTSFTFDKNLFIFEDESCFNDVQQGGIEKKIEEIRWKERVRDSLSLRSFEKMILDFIVRRIIKS